jgi:hypothetical protein
MKILCKFDKIVKLEDLKENPKNPNIHSTEQIDRLCKLFEYYGIRHPIIVSNQSGLMVVGHGRKQAAEKLGWSEFPVVYQDFESEDQEYGFIVADNAIADWSKLDMSMINFELPNLDGMTFNIELLGLKDFKVETAELPETKKEKNKKICPNCNWEL